MKVVAAIILVIGFVKAYITFEDVLEAEFQYFKEDYNKSYDSHDEEELRMQIFKDNKELIDKHNKLYADGDVSYQMGVNQFTDLLPVEFERLMLTSIDSTDLTSGIDYILNSSPNVEIPIRVDWRSEGAVTRVKNQRKCGSCWAFSAVAVLESHHFRKTNQLVALSEQNLVDCSSRAPYNNHGCNGGWYGSALNYIKNNGGINTERSYPYEAREGPCRYNRSSVGASVVGVAGTRKDDERALAVAVAEKGPIAVAIDASKLQHYKRGVFNDVTCGKFVNHAVVVVGYGHDTFGGDFWIVKNSWSTLWGEKGYIRMSRNRKNQCKIASYGIYPLV